jgi:hypothetical protein
VQNNEKMRFTFHFLVIFIAVIFVSCGPSEEDKARVKLNLAKSLLEKQDTLNAMLHLDSIADLYPEAVYSVNAAKNLMNDINFQLLQQKENQLDTIKVQIAELEKSFEKEKTQFDRYTQYIHKRQTFQRAWDRSYIQVHLDERGDLYLSSNYHGANWLNHVGLRVYDQGEDAKTDTIPLDDVNNHHSDFMEAKWEKVSYRNGKDNGVIEFIANNVDRNLKAVFLGTEYYYIILETYDKQAVKDALALSKAIKARTKLESEIQKLQSKLQIS